MIMRFKCEFQRGSKILLTLTKLKIKPDFPCLGDEIAEPHPDMNIKVAAFTVSEKSSNNNAFNTIHFTNNSAVLPLFRNAHTQLQT